ncbi:DUF417 family protein [Klebsiella aerogenes]|uniref:DUF417 family protein n=1 Tax=Klebsiella aerogenes TaxID=548 RepID=UPI001F2D7FE9|nr:DUF417 family protein [Klebsiella aerogenes]
MRITGNSTECTVPGVDAFILRLSLTIIFFFFGYAKWFSYEAHGLIPLISHSPLLSWMYSVTDIRGASRILGTAEWMTGGLLLLGFHFRFAGLLGASGSTVTFLTTTTLLISTPGMVMAEAGGFPALSSSAQFLLKDIVLLVASIVLFRAEITRNRDALLNISRSLKKYKRSHT